MTKFERGRRTVGLGWPPFKGGHNNKMKFDVSLRGGIGEGDATGAERVGCGGSLDEQDGRVIPTVRQDSRSHLGRALVE
jgi:hypothetical protein